MSLIVSKFIKPTTPDTVQAIVEMDKKKKGQQLSMFIFIMASNAKDSIFKDFLFHHVLKY